MAWECECACACAACVVRVADGRGKRLEEQDSPGTHGVLNDRIGLTRWPLADLAGYSLATHPKRRQLSDPQHKVEAGRVGGSP